LTATVLVFPSFHRDHFERRPIGAFLELSSDVTLPCYMFR
jgi:hypothetical protein